MVQLSRNGSTGFVVLILALIVVFTSLVAATKASHARNLHKRSFAGLGCMGVYDKAKFARLDRICEECYQMYREPEVHSLCRSNCFKNDSFGRCVDALLLKHEAEKLDTMVDELYGKRK